MKLMLILLFGGEFWSKVVNFVGLVEEGVINLEDIDLFILVEIVEEVWVEIVRFYELDCG